LSGAEEDAADMAELLRGEAARAAGVGTLSLVLGAEATTASVMSTLEETIRARVEASGGSPDEADTLLFYFAGHGRRDEAGLTLITWDGELPAAELLRLFEGSPYPTSVVLDCCHAGAITIGQPGAETPGKKKQPRGMFGLRRRNNRRQYQYRPAARETSP
jgi:hypothetical protein